jgi:hypothetical protein
MANVGLIVRSILLIILIIIFAFVLYFINTGAWQLTEAGRRLYPAMVIVEIVFVVLLVVSIVRDRIVNKN